MRPTTVIFGGLGALALVAGIGGALATGDPGLAFWVLVGPGPFWAAGLFAAVRRPDRMFGTWFLLTGTAFLASVCLGDVLLPAIADRPGAWVVALLRRWADYLSGVTAIGLFAWFPSGRPQRAYERWVVWVAIGLAALLPPAWALTHPVMPAGSYPDPDAPVVGSPLYRPALDAAGPVVSALDKAFLGCVLIGVGLLALRYRRTSRDERRRIRLLLLGMGAAIVLFAAQFTVGALLDGAAEVAVSTLLWPLVVVVTLGSLVIATVFDGMFTIEQALRRSMLFSVLWALIAIAYVAAATALGLLAARFVSVAAAVVLAAAAALLFQPAQRRLERIADRWVFGARLDGYRVLARFGSALESAPRSADLLTAMAEAVRDGLALSWVRVRLDVLSAEGRAGLPTAGEPALVVPLVEGDATLGRIECGPRPDGPLHDEDRRLLHQLAAQAATAVRNLHLATELTARVAEIRRQADDLAASRARIVTAQDAERRRIQRDLHDGVQQEIVVLAANLATARQRLRRGDHDAGDRLTEVQHEVGALLNQVREFAHAIHPPVLADQGLLQAIEAQAARLPLGVVIEADAGLRGVHYPQHVEATAWYVLSEALTNVVKHAHARQVRVRLARPDGRLTLEVRDDGTGFDTGAAGGLGLAGLADRIATVHGTLRVESTPGQGTTLCAEIPLPEATGA